MNRNYITSIVDTLIISAVLVLNSSFTVSHKLAHNRKDELLASNSPNFSRGLLKVYKYLLTSLIMNVFSFIFVLWLFWPVEWLFLFLLTYKVALL